MSMKARLHVPMAIAAVLALHANAVRADAPTKAACMSAAEEADVLRRDPSRLTKALEKLRTCVADACPSIVREDCLAWREDVERRVATVVFGAEDENGARVAARVRLDGMPLVETIDGPPAIVDPGAHTFTFEAEGRPPLDVRVTLSEGQRNVAVVARYARAEPPKAVAPPLPTSEPPPAAPLPEAPTTTTTRATAWPTVGLVLFATAGASIGLGAFYGVRAISLQSEANCPDNVCGPGSSPDKLRDAQSAGTLSTVFFVTGGLLAAGGAVFYFVLPASSSARIRVSPLVAGTSIDGVVGARVRIDAF
jgi:hypothetical protein